MCNIKSVGIGIIHLSSLPGASRSALERLDRLETTANDVRCVIF
jgi:hypothetical protein